MEKEELDKINKKLNIIQQQNTLIIQQNAANEMLIGIILREFGFTQKEFTELIEKVHKEIEKNVK